MQNVPAQLSRAQLRALVTSDEYDLSDVPVAQMPTKRRSRTIKTPPVFSPAPRMRNCRVFSCDSAGVTGPERGAGASILLFVLHMRNSTSSMPSGFATKQPKYPVLALRRIGWETQHAP
jgi:hypothetical protein